MVIEPPKIWWFHNDPRKRWGFPWGFLIKVGFSKIFRTISLGHLTGSCRFKEFRIRMVFNNQRCGFETLIAECSKPQFYYFKNQVFNHETQGFHGKYGRDLMRLNPTKMGFCRIYIMKQHIWWFNPLIDWLVSERITKIVHGIAHNQAY